MASRLDISNMPEDDLEQQVKSVRSELQVTPLDAKSRIGYHLARLVLLMISVFLVFLIIYVFINLSSSHSNIDYKSLTNLPDSSLNKKLTIIKSIQAENKDSRDFVIQISQMVLLNILLPILTAILGYIFGSHSEAKD